MIPLSITYIIIKSLQRYQINVEKGKRAYDCTRGSLAALGMTWGEASLLQYWSFRQPFPCHPTNNHYICTNHQRHMQSSAYNNQHPLLTPGEQLVLTAMKLKPTASDIARMEAYVNEVTDWEYVTQLAIDRGIGPMLNHKIPMLSNKHLIPAEAQQRLQQSYLRTLARGMRLYEAFREVGTALNEAGIKFVALKGVYLAEALYEDIGLRLFSDIDLLVAEEDGERSLEVLRGKGFTSTAETIFQTEFVGKHRKVVHFPPMIKGDISIEVHVRLHGDSPEYKFDIPAMIRDAVPVNIGGIEAHTLNIYDCAVFIAVHADKHFRNGHFQVKGYGDLVNYIDALQEKFKLTEFKERCQLHNCTNAVFKHINLADVFISFDTMLHWDGIKIDVDKDVKSFIQFFKGKTIKPNPANSLRKDLAGVDGAWNKLIFLWQMLHPSKAFMVNRYKIKNPANYRVYYVKRYWEGLVALVRKLGNWSEMR